MNVGILHLAVGLYLVASIPGYLQMTQLSHGQFGDFGCCCGYFVIKSKCNTIIINWTETSLHNVYL